MVRRLSDYLTRAAVPPPPAAAVPPPTQPPPAQPTQLQSQHQQQHQQHQQQLPAPLLQPQHQQQHQLPPEQPHVLATLRGADLSNMAQQLRTLHQRRVAQHGPRLFRWKDGSLRSQRPADNPYAVASRAVWQDLVDHCRGAGSDAHCAARSWSLCDSVGKSYQQHVNYLSAAELLPEQDEDKRFTGLQSQTMDPLQDATHAFIDATSPWKAVSEAVFAGAPFQWHGAGERWLARWELPPTSIADES